MVRNRYLAVVCAFKVKQKYERYREVQKKIDKKLNYDNTDEAKK